MFDIVYVLVEKTLATGDVFIVGVYDSYELAGEVMRDHIDLYGHDRSYTIVDKAVV